MSATILVKLFPHNSVLLLHSSCALSFYKTKMLISLNKTRKIITFIVHKNGGETGATYKEPIKVWETKIYKYSVSYLQGLMNLFVVLIT